ncbi:hypothetical protein [Paludisphaera mucosa]|uniref:Uncharacterized protein n=1 Tax=Paludisphaera mucosa TaxID=3030827 RepID=A0ABT6FDU3_9BACT|nr:hypothetical protein [Paludisphaera mucosa]MDG3005754.1 hypothetical protein [Paludisphaera mucosa]
MPRYWECPSCRALLTRERLESTAGACPYCDARVGPPAEFADPDAPPAESAGRRLAPIAVPRTGAGKLAASLRLFFENLPLIAALVLMIKLPSNAAVELIAARQGGPTDPLANLMLKGVVDLFFGPIYAAAVLTIMADRMAGRPSTFLEAARAGIDAWGRVFAARLLAGLSIFLAGSLGILLRDLPPIIRLVLLIPGIVLAVRYCLVDEVIVLEHTAILDSRRRSADLVSGRAWRIVGAGAAALAIIGVVSVLVGETADRAGLLDGPLTRALCDCLLDVFAVFYSILLFLFYWEARAERESDVALDPALEDHPS